MNTKTRAAEAAPKTDTAKVGSGKDLCKVLEYFRYKVGTSLDAARELGILRNSITWYIDELEKLDVLQAVCRRPDRTTHFMAKHYSADRSLWRRNVPQQPDLFGSLAHGPVIDPRSGEVNIMALWQQRKEAQNG